MTATIAAVVDLPAELRRGLGTPTRCVALLWSARVQMAPRPARTVSQAGLADDKHEQRQPRPDEPSQLNPAPIEASPRSVTAPADCSSLRVRRSGPDALVRHLRRADVGAEVDSQSRHNG